LTPTRRIGNNDLDAHAAGLAREGVTIGACYPKANKADINRGRLWPIFME